MGLLVNLANITHEGVYFFGVKKCCLCCRDVGEYLHMKQGSEI